MIDLALDQQIRTTTRSARLRVYVKANGRRHQAAPCSPRHAFGRWTMWHVRASIVWAVVFLSVVLVRPMSTKGGTIQVDQSAESSNGVRKVVLIAGPITGHPKQTHEYEKSVILLKHLLDHAENLPDINTEVHFQGWPQDESTLDDAHTIVFISDGSDRNESDHPLYVGERFAVLKRQMERGCGLVMFHWSTFHPRRVNDEILEWVGGYFDYESGTAANGWYSAIQTWQSDVSVASPEHAISRGVDPFRIQEEFYYRLRLAEKANRDAAESGSAGPATSILATTPPGEVDPFTVGWAVERKNGGRGFGFTGGHFYRNWWNDDFRRAILNAIVWTAGLEVPQGGVQTELDEPIRMLIVTGYHSPHHDWNRVTGALIKVLEQDPRVFVDVAEEVEDLAKPSVTDYDMLVFNYCNWDRDGLSDAAKKGLTDYLKKGGGMSVIHFANGSFTDTVPNANGDWPEFRTRIVRRIWVHGEGKSGHDAYGPFRVEPTEVAHPITSGLEPFETYDELYFNQEGELPIEPLATAHSRMTGKNEPMAWAYQYGEGRIFQTVLGHAEPSILAAGALIRRGSVWASAHENLDFDPPLHPLENYLWRDGSNWKPHESPQESSDQSAKPRGLPAPNEEPLVDGRFDQALNATDGGLWVSSSSEVREPPLTVAAWVKLDHARGFNIIAASEAKASQTHWELYTYAGEGDLAVYLPGIPPGEIRSARAICDGEWHYVGFTFSPQRVTLYVDGEKVKEQEIDRPDLPSTNGPLAIGTLAEGTIGCAGIIDDLVMMNAIVELTDLPDRPSSPNAKQIVRFSFDSWDPSQGTFPNSAAPQRPGYVDRERWQTEAQDADSSQSAALRNKVEGHWGEDAIGFAWQEADSVDDRWQRADIGPCLAGTFPIAGSFCRKGLAIQISAEDPISACFDTQHLTWRGLWHDGFLEFDPARFGLIKHPQPAAKPVFLLGDQPAWNGQSQEWIGYQQSGRQVALHYQVDGTHIREVPLTIAAGNQTPFIREIEIQPHDQPMTLLLADQLSEARQIEKDEQIQWCRRESHGQTEVLALVSPRENNFRFERQNEQLLLRVDASGQTQMIQLIYWMGDLDDWSAARTSVMDVVDSDSGTLSLRHAFSVSHSIEESPSTPLWNPPIEMPVTLADETKSPYVVDTFHPPFDNRFGALLFISGHDFLTDGTAVLCTVHGDVWLVKGILQSATTRRVTWKRFATGLYQPLGIRVVDDQIYVLGRDQITRLHDCNGDEEADFYENFNNDGQTSTGTHDYAAGLETDPEGRFYFVRGNTGVERVSADGQEHTVIATGLRNPNGIGMNPEGVLTVAPQEGEWTPASCIAIVHEGDYFGYGGPRITPGRPLGYDQPLCWLPRLVDNSSGGQCWVDSDRWGPLHDHWIHLSYGRCWMMLVLSEEIGTETQGGVIQFPFEFDSGVSRARFHPGDGQLYVSGLRGWSSSAVQDGCFQRVRYTGQPVRMPIGIETVANGVILKFATEIDESFAQDRLNYFVERWNYRYAADYGSPEFSVSHPNRQGRDEVYVRSATLLENRRSVFLELEDHRPVMQLAVNYSLQDSQGEPFDGIVYQTLHHLGNRKEAPGVHAASAIVDEQRLLEQRLERGWVIDVESSDLDDRFIIRTASLADPGRFPISSIDSIDWRQIRIHGLLKIEQPGDYRIVVDGAKQANLQVGDQALDVLASGSSGESVSSERCEVTVPNLTRGYTPFLITIERRHLQGSIQVQWEGPSFSLEPVSPKLLYHDPSEPKLVEYNLLRSGKSLYATKGCLRCHGKRDESNDEHEFVMFEHSIQAPSLESIASRLRPAWIRAWLLNPQVLQSHASMPRLLDDQYPEDVRQATAITNWLIDSTTPGDEPVNTSELDATSNQIRSGERMYERLGCISCHYLERETNNDKGDRRSLAEVGLKYHPRAIVDYLLKPQRHHPLTRMPDFQLSEDEAVSLAAFILQETAGQPLMLPSWTSNREYLSEGRKAFEQLGCRQCHSTETGLSPVAPQFEFTTSFNVAKGCLDPQAARSRHIPDIELSVSERRALRLFLSSNRSSSADTPRESALRLVQYLNCQACHDRDGDRSRFAELVLEEGWSGLAPETLPDLTWTGEKLHATWTKQLIHGDIETRSRPWLEARMPAFPGYAKWIADGIAAEHAIDSKLTPSTFQANPKLAEDGLRLTRLPQGFDCRQCHGVGDEPPTGDEKTQLALGINFTLVPQRLRQEYFDRWMRDPLRIDPLTKMPKYTLDGGQTKISSFFDGNAAEQYDAVWHYLQSLHSAKSNDQ